MDAICVFSLAIMFIALAFLMCFMLTQMHYADKEEGRTMEEPKQERKEEPAIAHGNYECFHCCTRGVIWDSDFDFEDFGYEGQGIVHICHCANCGAEIEYRIPIPDDEEETDNE
jgi:hypothetical protein